MNILSAQFLNNGYVSFKSHNRDVREADEIMRKARNAFPMSSATRISTFCQNRKNISAQNQETINNLQRRIHSLRLRADKMQDSFRYISNPYMPYLNEIRQNKIGNCYESTISTIAALRANGYRAAMANLNVTYTILDKKDKSVIFDTEYCYDHVFTVTDMGKKDLPYDKKIVLDAWLGLCGTWQEVGSKYNMICSEDDEVKSFLYASRQIFLEMLKEKYPGRKFSDFEEKISFEYWTDPADCLQDKKIKRQIKHKFPELVLDKKRK